MSLRWKDKESVGSSTSIFFFISLPESCLPQRIREKRRFGCRAPRWFCGEGEVPFLAKDLFPMGRLDKDTEGLLILTNDGELAHRLLSPKFHVEKTYLVQLDTAVSGEDVLHMKEGLDIGEKQLTKPAKMEILSERECLLTITEGKFHQVKRMFHKLGKEVVYLKRVAMAGIKLEDSLEKGQWRQLTEKEIEKLKEQADGKKEILCSEEGKNTGNLSDVE